MTYPAARRVLVRAGFVLALIAAACSSDDESQDNSQTGTDGGSAGTSGGAGGAGASASGDGGDGNGVGSGGGGAAGASGAGSGGGGAGSASDAGPDDAFGAMEGDDRALSSLNDQEAKELCLRLSALADTIADEDDVARLGCVLLASVFGGSGGTFDPAVCEDAVQDCLLTGDGVISTMRCEPELLHEATADCALTIAQYRECVVASAEQLAEQIDTFSCQSIGASGIPSNVDMSASSIAECAPVMAACPALFEPEGEPAADGCNDTCSDAADSFCDDGGPGSLTDICALGTDCIDCGPR